MSASRYLWQLYRARVGWLGAAYLGLATTWLAGAGLLAVSGWFITAAGMVGLGLLAGLNLFTPSAAIRGLALGRTLARYAERVIGHEAILRVLADLRIRLFGVLSAQPASADSRWRHGDLLTRLLTDVDTLDGAPLRVVGPVAAALVTVMVTVMLSLVFGTPAIALLLVLGSATTLWVSVWCARAGTARGRALIESRAAQRQAWQDHLGGMAELIAYDKLDSSEQRLQRLDREQLSRQRHQEQMAAWSEHSVQAVIALVMTGVLALGWGRVEAPFLALLALMTLGLTEALGSLPGALWRWSETRTAANRVADLEAPVSPDSQPNQRRRDTRRAPGAQTPHDPPGPGELRIEHLRCQRQPPGTPPWSATLVPGRPCVIHGASGAGKSSVVLTLAGELPADTGSVWHEGRDLLTLADAERYAAIAVLAQDDGLLDMSVAEFLCLGLDDIADDQLWAALAAVDLQDSIAAGGEGLSYRLGSRGSRLSGGQIRRLQLAALWLRDPVLVLLDEPFRGMERALVEHILRAFEPWFEQRCVLIVSHQPQWLPTAWCRQSWPPAP